MKHGYKRLSECMAEKNQKMKIREKARKSMELSKQNKGWIEYIQTQEGNMNAENRTALSQKEKNRDRSSYAKKEDYCDRK